MVAFRGACEGRGLEWVAVCTARVGYRHTRMGGRVGYRHTRMGGRVGYRYTRMGGRVGYRYTARGCSLGITSPHSQHV